MLTWEKIVERGKQHNKTVLCEVEKRGRNRYFKVKCNLCGFEKEERISRFSGCFKCFFKKITNDDDYFILKSKKVHGNKYNYDFVEYINSYTKVKILCNNCDEIFEQRPNDHLKGRGCSNCGLKSRVFSRTMKINEFISKAKYLHKNKYNYDSSQYVNSLTNIKIYCNRCNLFFEQRPSHHLSGHGCPKCFESKGENRVAKYLLENNIIFTPQKTFKTLRDIRPLFPDFHLENLNLLIEYDGRGHYVACFGSTPEEKQKNLEDCQRRDKIKNEWAKANNIPLLRIPYWDFDRIEELIEAFIIQHTKKKEIKQLVLEM